MNEEVEALLGEAEFKREAYEKMTRERERYAAEKEMDEKRFKHSRCLLWHDWIRIGIVSDRDIFRWLEAIKKSAVVLWECSACGKREQR